MGLLNTIKGTFLATLDAEGLLETTDVVIVSDHGMDGYDGKTKQNIVEGFDVNDLEKGVEWGSYMSLQVAEEADPASVAASINAMDGVQAWASEDIPDNLQGGPSGCTLPFLDIKTKVPSQYIILILKCNAQFDVNKT